MVVALADIAGLQKVASFTLNNLYQPGDNIHTTYVEDTGSAGEFLLCAAADDFDDANIIPEASRDPDLHTAWEPQLIPPMLWMQNSSALMQCVEADTCYRPPLSLNTAAS